MLGDSLKRRRGRPRRPDDGSGDGRRPSPRAFLGWLGSGFSLGRWLVLAALILVLSYGTGYLLSTLVLFPRPETAGSAIEVPELAGRTLTEAQSAILEAGLALGDVRVVTSMETDSGRVLAQAPVPGQRLLPGGAVSLGVSGGAPEIRVPPVAGLGEGAARELVEAVGFDVDVQQTRSPTVPVGVVARSEPEVGTPLELPAVVTLVVSTGPPPPGDTAGAPEAGGGG